MPVTTYKLKKRKVAGPKSLPDYPVNMYAAHSLEELEAWAEGKLAGELIYYTVEYRAGVQFVGAIPARANHSQS